MATERILLVDDEPGVRFGVGSFLRANGYVVDEAETCRSAEDLCKKAKPDAILLDYALPDGDGIGLIDAFRRAAPAAPIIMLTAHGSIELAVTAIKRGAVNLVTKPVQLPSLLALLRQSIDLATPAQPPPQEQSEDTRARQLHPRAETPFVGSGPTIARLQEQAKRVLTSKSPVLILGETGVGKGVLARWIHASGGGSGRFVDINCAGLTEALLDSELFGHARGAFTSALSAKPGLFEMADGGTVFLDEVGDMPLAIQAKLLKVLEEKRYRRVGEVHDREMNSRIVTATHRNLSELVGRGTFRTDLYFRLTTLPLYIPPLRARQEDIPSLAASILRMVARDTGRGEVSLSARALDALTAHGWPGNIRELRNVIERALVMTDGRMIDREHLRLVHGASVFPPEPDAESPSGSRLKTVERAEIEDALRAERGHVGEAARRLGVPRSTLYAKIKRYGIVPSKS